MVQWMDGMPNPLDTLRNYFSTGGSGTPDSPYAPWQKTAQNVIEGGIEGLKGLVGIGDEVPSSEGWNANHIGQLLSAVAPLRTGVIGRGLEGPHPAIRALMDTLSGAPEAVDPAKLFLGEKTGSYYVPHRAMITPPEGFDIPAGTNRFMERDPALSDLYVNQRGAFSNKTAADLEPRSNAPGRKAEYRSVRRMDKKVGTSEKDLLSGFDSKFGLTGPDVNAKPWDVGRKK